MTFTCGCQPPTYCPTHWVYPCHNELIEPSDFEEWERECPPCRTARWASVNLDSRATPTRRER